MSGAFAETRSWHDSAGSVDDGDGLDLDEKVGLGQCSDTDTREWWQRGGGDAQLGGCPRNAFDESAHLVGGGPVDKVDRQFDDVVERRPPDRASDVATFR